VKLKVKLMYAYVTCVDESYSVPLDVEFTVDVKPRSLSGVLLSVFSHGAGPPGGDYLVLQLVNGQVCTAHTLQLSFLALTDPNHSRGEVCLGCYCQCLVTELGHLAATTSYYS